MIINKVNIIAFGGLKNKYIDLENGINVIFGENEAGKSTIQSFIKIWLYGFSSCRGKDYKSNERLKYTPLNGEKINGELHITFEGKRYIIKRIFGKTKKEDECNIFDAVSGDEIYDINKDEPGKSIFGVNRATFINTLFIGQLAVSVKKDKEEEIINKISNSISVSQGQVSIDTAFSKLDSYKKSISNNRKNGILDLLREKKSKLLIERYEAYELSKNNLENEDNLIKLRIERDNLNTELNNLDIYKKNLRKVKLQKKYREIIDYFKKKEALHNEEELINKDITFNNEIINENVIRDIREEFYMYLNLLDMKIEEEDILNKKLEELEKLKEPVKKYTYIEELPDNILSILERLKIKDEVLREKIDINREIENELKILYKKKQDGEALIRNKYEISSIREILDKLLTEYEEKLKELKYLVENYSKDKLQYSNKVFNITVLVIFFVGIVIGFIIKNKILCIFLYLISISSLIVFLVSHFLNYNSKLYNIKIRKIEREIKNIEDHLDEYVKDFQVDNYSQLFKKVKIYDDYISLESKINEKISDKLAQRQVLDLEKVMAEFEENEKEINRYIKIGKIKNLDQLIYEIENYKKISNSFLSIDIEVKNLKSNLEKNMNQLLFREESLKSRLKSIGLGDIKFDCLEDTLDELEKKIKKKYDISKSLASVEEAYTLLIKDKDINSIKEELKDVININFDYSYKNEAEVDIILKEKNGDLLNIEKKIKDVENEINNRFIGKRHITEIEEDIQNVEIEISQFEKVLKASDIANEALKNAYDEIRKGFGPELNNKVISSFNYFTSGKYNEVMVSDNYEMKVLTNGEILSSDILSNGANDQLYLSLRLAFIEMIFKNKNIPIYLDDAFVQYDDTRAEKTLIYLINEKYKQYLIFTCQKREENILRKNRISHKYIKIV